MSFETIIERLKTKEFYSLLDEKDKSRVLNALHLSYNLGYDKGYEQGQEDERDWMYYLEREW